MASRDSRPIIGLTTYLEQAQCGVWDVRASFLPEVYLEAIERSGGAVMLIPPQPADFAVARDLISRVDALVIPGGKDVDPARYGAEPHPTTDSPRHDRDGLEDALLTVGIERNLPILGICRGAQIMNVHQGGTLIQHLPEVVGHEDYQKGDGVFSSMSIIVEAETLLAEILGAGTLSGGQVYHHQAILEPGRDIRVSARTHEGVIEAIELTTIDFGLAVQWHPEESHREDPRLFDALVRAAHQFRSTR